ncbi:MAG: hypothetical protein ACRC1D_09415 [Culicoidibacterales bacterium]
MEAFILKYFFMKQFNVKYKESVYVSAHYATTKADGRAGHRRAGEIVKTRERVGETWKEEERQINVFTHTKENVLENKDLYKKVYDLDLDEEILFPLDLNLFGCKDVEIFEIPV